MALMEKFDKGGRTVGGKEVKPLKLPIYDPKRGEVQPARSGSGLGQLSPRAIAARERLASASMVSAVSNQRVPRASVITRSVSHPTQYRSGNRLIHRLTKEGFIDLQRHEASGDYLARKAVKKAKRTKLGKAIAIGSKIFKKLTQ